MPNKKIEKRRRKLRVHGPSPESVGAPPTGRKPPRASGGTTTAKPRGQRTRREIAVPSLKRSARKGGFMAIFMVAIVVVTTRSHGTGAIFIALAETIPLIFLFVAFDLWMARKVYKRVTGEEAPR
jgi:ABC-type xylose transport system permease subunit